MTSKIETMNSLIHEFKLLHKAKGQRSLKSTYHLKKHLKSHFFILNALKDILQHYEFVDWRVRGFVFLMSQTEY